jgi:14-3-3 protein epsilon
MSQTREEHIEMAKLCEQTERFDEMLTHMRKVVEFSTELKTDERNLLSVAYKNSVGARRTAWRVVNSLEQKDEAKGSAHLSLLQTFKAKLEGELDTICGEIIKFLDDILLKNTEDSETRVFYLKMKADYFRYIAEYADEQRKVDVVEESFKAYQEAYGIATEHLKTINPIRLGLALNFSVFYYESKNDPAKACEMAKSAFDDAISASEELSGKDYKDSTMIMQLIRDNLTLWDQELKAEDDDDA